MVASLPSVKDVWAVLDRVPDPEIPVISLVDLGVIRAVEWVGETVQVSVTPTYSGCPATKMIADDIRAALASEGIESVKIIPVISPAWTTDWMTQRGRQNLLKYGIAPPNKTGEPNQCPQCASTALSRISQFGSTPCKALWRCDECLEPFDFFKCI